jgi:hypothetical protein
LFRPDLGLPIRANLAYGSALRPLTVSVIATASVLVERAGGQLPDVEPDQAAAWAQFRHEHGHFMPR